MLSRESSAQVHLSVEELFVPEKLVQSLELRASDLIEELRNFPSYSNYEKYLADITRLIGTLQKKTILNLRLECLDLFEWLRKFDSYSDEEYANNIDRLVMLGAAAYNDFNTLPNFSHFVTTLRDKKSAQLLVMETVRSDLLKSLRNFSSYSDEEYNLDDQASNYLWLVAHDDPEALSDFVDFVGSLEDKLHKKQEEQRIKQAVTKPLIEQPSPNKQSSPIKNSSPAKKTGRKNSIADENDENRNPNTPTKPLVEEASPTKGFSPSKSDIQNSNRLFGGGNKIPAISTTTTNNSNPTRRNLFGLDKQRST